MLQLGLVTVVVSDYDDAIAFYVGKLGLRLLEDTDLGNGKRWVVVTPGGGANVLLAKAAGDHQASRIGDQTGGRVAFFLETDDFAAEYDRLTGAGVHFEETARTEAYGQVAVFQDLYGNRWDLIQSRSG